MEIYLKIGAMMEKHNLTNQALADLSGVPVGTVSGIRSGKIANPSFDAVCTILRAMDEPVDALFDAPSIRQSTSEMPNVTDANAQQRKTILEQTATVAAQAATLEARNASISMCQAQIASLQAELQMERKRTLRLQTALVALFVAFVALAAVYIWDVRNLHLGLTAYFNPR